MLAVSITENGHDGGRQEELLLGGDPGDRSEVLQDTGGHWKGEDGAAWWRHFPLGLKRMKSKWMENKNKHSSTKEQWKARVRRNKKNVLSGREWSKDASLDDTDVVSADRYYWLRFWASSLSIGFICTLIYTHLQSVTSAALSHSSPDLLSFVYHLSMVPRLFLYRSSLVSLSFFYRSVFLSHSGLVPLSFLSCSTRSSFFFLYHSSLFPLSFVYHSSLVLLLFLYRSNRSSLLFLSHSSLVHLLFSLVFLSHSSRFPLIPLVLLSFLVSLKKKWKNYTRGN